MSEKNDSKIRHRFQHTIRVCPSSNLLASLATIYTAYDMNLLAYILYFIFFPILSLDYSRIVTKKLCWESLKKT